MLFLPVDANVKGLSSRLATPTRVVGVHQMSVDLHVAASTLLPIVPHALTQNLSLAGVQLSQVWCATNRLQIAKLVEDQSNIAYLRRVGVKSNANLEIKLIIVTSRDCDGVSGNNSGRNAWYVIIPVLHGVSGIK